MPFDSIKIPQIADVSTSGTAVATSRADSDVRISGLIEYIIIDLSGAAGPDIDIDIKTVGNTGSGASRTLWSADDITADTTICLRQQAVTAANANITNHGGKIAVINDTIRVDAYDANKASINIDVWIVYSK